ncbi:MAG: hypothetical protein JEZ11_16420 [Desulfobacterales bacterium]|nr:hypothetical protein [Desulfobacterales bacterium]
MTDVNGAVVWSATYSSFGEAMVAISRLKKVGPSFLTLSFFARASRSMDFSHAPFVSGQ